MNILFDHCVPKPLRRPFPAHHIRTAAQMGCKGLQNGKLLAQAATAFDVLLTVDKNIKSQQNLDKLPIAVVILDAPTNTSEVLAPFAPFVELLLSTIQPGQMWEIDCTGKLTRIGGDSVD